MNADIDEIHRRLTLAVKERCEYLKSTVDNYLTSELKNLKELHSNLDLELTNIQSNADLMEKHMADDTKWDDNELMDCKVSGSICHYGHNNLDIFLRINMRAYLPDTICSCLK